MSSYCLNLQSSVMDKIRWPLIVLVVFIHTIPGHFADITGVPLDEAVYNFVSNLISSKLGQVAVPTFFFISGYFLFHKTPNSYDINAYKNNIKKKFWTLFVPYILWNLFYLSLIWCKSIVSRYTNVPLYDYELGVLSQPVWYHLLDPLDYPLWYIKDLIFMNLISFMIFWFLKNIKIVGVISISFIYHFCVISDFTLFSIVSLYFVTLGAFCGMNNIDILALTRPIRWLIGSAFIALLILATIYNQESWIEYIIRLYIPLGIITLMQLTSSAYLGISSRLRNYLRVPYNYLLRATFFVYAIHTIYIINWVIAGLGRLGLNTGYSSLVGYFLTPMITILGCLVGYHILRIIAPRLLGLLTGGRY